MFVSYSKDVNIDKEWRAYSLPTTAYECKRDKNAWGVMLGWVAANLRQRLYTQYADKPMRGGSSG